MTDHDTLAFESLSPIGDLILLHQNSPACYVDGVTTLEKLQNVYTRTQHNTWTAVH